MNGSDGDKFVQKINKMARKVVTTSAPIATTSSQSITLPQLQTTSNTVNADTSQIAPQIITDITKASPIVSSPQKRKRKGCEESNGIKFSTQSQRIGEDDSRENTLKTKRRKKNSERKSLKRKSYLNETFALQRLDINNEADNEADSLEPDILKKPKLEI